jgi:hypothetical protein
MRFAEIERENRQLLKALAHTITKGNIDNVYNVKPKSLNSTIRRREQSRWCSKIKRARVTCLPTSVVVC